VNAEAIVKNLLRESVEDGVAAFIEHLKKVTGDNFGSNWSGRTPPEHIKPPTFSTDIGPKYIRIVKSDGSSRSVYCFVERATGDIWYPASWKGPAKNFTRGNVNDSSSWGAHFGPHGMIGTR